MSPVPGNMPIQPTCPDPVLRYAPFVSGKYDMSPGLSHLRLEAGDPHKRLIQIDCEYPEYRANKQACRNLNLSRHVLDTNLDPETRRWACQTLIEALCSSYPAYFKLEAPGRLQCQLSAELIAFTSDYELLPHPVYQSLWDALADQIPEDLAIWQLQGDRDFLAALHVCAPNGWAPADKIGLSFDQVHAPVPGMERQRVNYLPLLKGLIQKPAFCRFIWDLRTCPELNHHPQAHSPPPFNPDAPRLYVRLERQLLYGLPACNAVLFMIRTYRYPVRSLSLPELTGLNQALAAMPPQILAYKHLDRHKDAIRNWLRQLIQAQS